MLHDIGAIRVAGAMPALLDRMRLALNGEFVDVASEGEVTLRTGDEIDILPPVAGGWTGPRRAACPLPLPARYWPYNPVR